MKANEFVKNYGWEKAKKVIKNAHWENISYGIGHYYSNSCGEDDVLLDDLKCLIESHDLVEKLNGLSVAKDTLKRATGCSCIRIGWLKSDDGKDLEFTTDRLDQAIADVESCQ